MTGLFFLDEWIHECIVHDKFWKWFFFFPKKTQWLILNNYPMEEKAELSGKVPDSRGKTKEQRRNSTLRTSRTKSMGRLTKQWALPHCRKESGCPCGGSYSRFSTTKISPKYTLWCFLLLRFLQASPLPSDSAHAALDPVQPSRERTPCPHRTHEGHQVHGSDHCFFSYTGEQGGVLEDQWRKNRHGKQCSFKGDTRLPRHKSKSLWMKGILWGDFLLLSLGTANV